MATFVEASAVGQTAPLFTGSYAVAGAGQVSSMTITGVVVPSDCALLAIAVAWGRNANRSITGVTWQRTSPADPSPTSVTEQIDTFSTVSGERAGVGLFYLVNPPVGTGTITVTFDGNVDAGYVFAQPIANVDTASPIAASNSSTSSVTRTSASVSLSPTTPSLMLGVAAWSRVLTSFTPGAGVTELQDGHQSGGGDLSYWVGVMTVDDAGTFSFGVTAADTRAGALAVMAIAGQ